MTNDPPRSVNQPEALAPEPPRDDDSVARRIARLESAEKRCRYVGTGFAGLVLLVGVGGLLDGAGVIRSTVVTLVILGVASLGVSVVNILLEIGRLRGKVVSGQVTGSDPAGEYDPHPHYWYVAGVAILTCGAMILLIGTWLPLS